MCDYGLLENYGSLGAGIVKFALDDYTATIKSLNHYYEKLDKVLSGETKVTKHHQRVGDICRYIYSRLRNLDEIERFLTSEWVQHLTTIDTEYVFQETKKRLKQKGYKVNLMGLIVTTDDKGVRIFAHEKEGKNGKFMTYSLGISTKDQSGNWVNGYVSCKFKKGVTVENKAKIKIKSAFFVANKSNNKSFTYLMITDFELLEPGETGVNDEVVKIVDDIGDETPFL